MNGNEDWHIQEMAFCPLIKLEFGNVGLIEERGKLVGSTWRKTSWSKDENQKQTQPTQPT